MQTGSPAPVEGPTKGLVEIAAVVLASAQMIQAAAAIIREWAAMDAGREFTLEVQKDDGTLVITGRGRAGIEAARATLQAQLPSLGPSVPSQQVASLGTEPDR